ncbi:MAG: OmpA family protein [Candidatus Omnitrophica bacterium]|nr:OmpA family protein [Candidatus Omnitrophota bacterium]
MNRLYPFSLLILTFFLSSCAAEKELERVNRDQSRTIQNLKAEVSRLNQELDQLMHSKEELNRAKTDMERKLQSEMDSGNLSVSMQERGLVVTVLDRVLFDSGRAELKESSKSTLDKVAQILQDRVKSHRVYVEGHTDNIPIRVSGWRSNWELSTARATEVVHYFVEENTLDPERLAATGYGEFHPLFDNNSSEGRLKNRRVEIVISPKKLGGPSV